MLRIGKSQTADTRTCDFRNVTRDTLGASSVQHIGDVRLALAFFAQLLHRAAAVHECRREAGRRFDATRRG